MAGDIAEYSPVTHEADLWHISDAAKELGVRVVFDSTGMHMSLRMAEVAGGTVNEEYMGDLKTVRSGLEHQHDFAAAEDETRRLEGFTRPGLLDGVRSAITAKIALRQRQVNTALARTGLLPIVINDKGVLDADVAKVDAYWNQREEGVTPVFPDDEYDHPGDRIAKLVECLDMNRDEWYYRYLIEGKSGQRYVFNPKSSFPRLMVDSRLILPKSTSDKSVAETAAT